MEQLKAPWKSSTVHLTFAILAGLATFLVYIPSLDYVFMNWDDPLYVTENPFIYSMGGNFWRTVFIKPIASNWHPLTIISYAIDYKYWYLNPKGYHLTNNFFHSLNTALVYALAAKVSSLALKKADMQKVVFTSLLASLLFGLHPAHVESVAWVSERKDVLSAFFLILALLSYIKYSLSVHKKWYYCLTLVLFTLSLLSKPMAVTFPVIILILDFYPLERWGNIKRVIIEKLPFFVISGISAYLTLLAQQGAYVKEGVLPLTTRIFTAIRAIVFYIYKMILPFDLAPYYPHPVKIEIFSAEYLGAAVFLIGITILCVFIAKRSKAFLAAWLYYIVTLLPVLGLIQVGSQAAADRYTYIPSLSLVILVPCMIVSFTNGLERKTFIKIGSALIILLSVSLGFGTVKQVAIWKNPMTLWSYEIEKYPNAHVPLNNRGLYRQGNGDMRGAIEDFTKAIEAAPELAELYNNRGAAYQIVEDYGHAIEDYRRTLAIDPNMKNTNYNMGLTYQKMANHMAAVESYTRELALNQANVEAYIHRGLALRDLGRSDLSIADFTTAIKLAPSYVPAYVNRGITFWSLNSSQQALGDLERVLELSPDNQAALYYSASAYMKIGKRDKAVANLLKASELGLPEADEALKQLGVK